jgi:hypothetical protein
MAQRMRMDHFFYAGFGSSLVQYFLNHPTGETLSIAIDKDRAIFFIA